MRNSNATIPELAYFLIVAILAFVAGFAMPHAQLQRFGAYIQTQLASNSSAQPDKSVAYFAAGAAAERQDNLLKAQSEYQAGENANPTNVSNFAALADLYAREGENELADENYRAAITLAPTAPSLHYRLGLLEMRERLYAAAVYDFNAELQYAPNFQPARHSLQLALTFFKAQQAGARPSHKSPPRPAKAAASPPSVANLPASRQNIIFNGSFERGADFTSWEALQTGSTDINGWRVVSGRVDYVGSYWRAADGNRSVDLDGTPGPGGIAQIFPTQVGHNYRVTFSLAGNPEGPPRLKRLRAIVAGENHYFTFDDSGHARSSLGWVNVQFTFVAISTHSTLEFDSLDAIGNWNGPVIDNVNVQSL